MSLDDTINLNPYIYEGDVMALPWVDRYALYVLMGIVSYLTAFGVSTAIDSSVVPMAAAVVAGLAVARVGYAALGGRQ